MKTKYEQTLSSSLNTLIKTATLTVFSITMQLAYCPTTANAQSINFDSFTTNELIKIEQQLNDADCDAAKDKWYRATTDLENCIEYNECGGYSVGDLQKAKEDAAEDMFKKCGLDLTADL